jgi:hypothetical protein
MLHSNEVFLGGGLYVPIRSVVQTFKLHIHNIGRSRSLKMETCLAINVSRQNELPWVLVK